MRGEECQIKILQFLHEGGPGGFEEICKAVGASRRTVNKHLKKLYNDKIVAQMYGARGKYFLTEEGKEYAKKELFKWEAKNVIDQLSSEEIINTLDMVENIPIEYLPQMMRMGLKAFGDLSERFGTLEEGLAFVDKWKKREISDEEFGRLMKEKAKELKPKVKNIKKREGL